MAQISIGAPCTEITIGPFPQFATIDELLAALARVGFAEALLPNTVMISGIHTGSASSPVRVLLQGGGVGHKDLRAIAEHWEDAVRAAAPPA